MKPSRDGPAYAPLTDSKPTGGPQTGPSPTSVCLVTNTPGYKSGYANVSLFHSLLLVHRNNGQETEFDRSSPCGRRKTLTPSFGQSVDKHCEWDIARLMLLPLTCIYPEMQLLERNPQSCIILPPASCVQIFSSILNAYLARHAFCLEFFSGLLHRP
jgi:hypothetical protein